MAWIIDGDEGVLTAVNTEGIKRIIVVEGRGRSKKKKIEVILTYREDDKHEIFTKETTAKLANVFEVLMKVIIAGENAIVTFDNIIEKAELMSKWGEK